MKINEAKGNLTSTYIDWSHILANPRSIRKNSQITWENYIPRMLKQPVMASDVIDLANTGQYTFQVITDGSLIQIHYQYDARGHELQSACLAFYSASTYEDEQLVEPFGNFQQKDINDIDDLYGEIHSEEFLREAIDETQLATLRDRPISWFRIDYDPVHAKGVLHHDCHMHFSAFPHSRLVVAGVPTPKQFVEFIMAFCYPEIYEQHRLDKNGQYTNADHILTINSNSIPSEEHNVFRQMAHFRIPIISEIRRK